MNPDPKHNPERNPAVLVEVTRGPVVESVHYGVVAVADVEGNLTAWAGNPGIVTYYRSACKPLQAVALLESGGAERFGLTDAEIAIICGSHGGESIHVETVMNILDKIAVGPDALACGTHVPLSPQAARGLRERGESPGVLHNNCSGKHAGMLALAKFHGWPVGGYETARHPVQVAMLEVISQFAGLEPEEVAVGVDGCGVCNFGIPVHNMATSFARLAQPRFWPEPRKGAVERIWRAMTAYPELVGYMEDNIDTDIMRAARGAVVSKRGAEGTYCAARRVGDEGRMTDDEIAVFGRSSSVIGQERSEEGALGFALKLLDGDVSGRARNPAIIEGLRQAGFLEEDALGRLEGYWMEEVANRPGDVVGMVRPAFTLSTG